MVRRGFGEIRLRRRLGIYPFVVHWRNQNIGRQPYELVARVGVTFLLERAQAEIKRLAYNTGLIDVAHPSAHGFCRG